MRKYFWAVSILLVVMGILGTIPTLVLGVEPLPHAITKIVIGIIGIVVLMRSKK